MNRLGYFLLKMADGEKLTPGEKAELVTLADLTEAGSRFANGISDGPSKISNTTIVSAGGNNILDETGLRIYNGSAPTGWWKTIGDLLAGSDISSPDTTTFYVFTTAKEYNNESFAAGDELLGSNSPGKANIKISPTAGTVEFRNGLIAQAQISFMDDSGSVGPGGINLLGLQYLLRFYAEYMGAQRWAQIGMGVAQDATAPSFSMMFYGPAGENLLQNGDAETGDLTNWTDDESAWSASTTTPNAGTYCFRHDPENDGCPGDLRQTITGLTAGTVYSCSFYSKITSGILSPRVELVWKTAASATVSTDVLYGNGTSDWVQSLQIYASPATADRVEIILYSGDPFNDSSFDDVVFSGQSISRQLGFFPDLTVLGGPIVLEELI